MNMDQRTQELKARKKACKQAKRKYVTLWKTLTLFFGVLALLLTAAAPVAYVCDNWVAVLTGESMQTLTGTDGVATYSPMPLLLPEMTEPADQMPTMGAVNGLGLYDVTGLPWDDPIWEALLDQLTYEDMLAICQDTYGWCMPLESVNAPGALVWEADLTGLDTTPEDSHYGWGMALGIRALEEGKTCLSVPAELIDSQAASGIRDSGIHVTLQGKACPYFQAECFESDRKDPAEVNRMRQLCHRELYGRANSVLMNGVGKDTRVQVEMLLWVRIIHWAAAGCWFFTLILTVLWIRGKSKWKHTQEYLDYRTMRNVIKQEKKQK